MGTGARRTVTVLFTDLVGSTEQRSRLGDDAADALRQTHDRLVGSAVTEHAGEVVKSTGDGLLAVFGAASDALDAAVAAQQALDWSNRTAPEPVAMRAGLGIGDVSVEDDGDVFGTPVVEASRLCDAAGDGQMLCTEFVRHMAGSRGGHGFDPIGELELKGLAAPVGALSVRWSPARGGVVPVPPLLTRSQAFGFVGRDDELDRLTDAWKRADGDGPLGVLISGEPGAGKTRLAAHLAAGLHDDGALVLAGRCDEDLGVPFQPFVEALRHWVAHTPETERLSGLGPTGGELVKLLPELPSLVPGVVEPPRSDPETERYRLFEGVVTWLSTQATLAPVLLVLDDLHWAAAPTLQLVRHVLRADAPGPMLVVGTYRDTDLDRSHPLSGVLADLRRDDGTERVSLKGLDRAGVERMLEVAAGHDLDDAGRALATAIWEETDGNAFFAESMIRHLADSGGVEHRDGRWTVTRSIVDLGLPEGIREVVGRRLGRLSDVADEVLHVAAVIGPEFDLAVLGRVTGRSEDEIDRVLAEAEAAGLLDDLDPTSGRFSHALVRSALSEEIVTRRRLRLHRQIAEAIEEVHEANLGRHLTQLALHHSEAAAAGEPAKAIEFNQRAGRFAAESAAWSDAAAHFRVALDLAEEDGADETTLAVLRCDLGEALGEAQLPGADAMTVHALETAQRIGRDDLVVRAALSFGRHQPGRGFGEPDETHVRLLRAGLDAVGEADSAERARIMVTLAAELPFTVDRIGERRAAVEEAISVARRSGDDVALARVLCQAAWVGQYDLDASLALVEEAEAQVAGFSERDLADSWTFGTGLNFRLAAGRFVEARPHLQRLLDQNAKVGGSIFNSWAVLADAGFRALCGDLTGAHALLHDHHELLRTMQARRQYVITAWFVQYHRGRPNDLPDVPGLGPTSERGTAMLAPGIALSLLDLGRPVDAERILTDAMRHLEPEPGRFLPIALDIGLVDEVAARVGLVDLAGRLYTADRRHRWVMVGPSLSGGSQRRVLGQLATCLERWDEAEAHFAAAEREHAEGAELYLIRGRLDWAWMLERRGDPADRDRARTLAQQARAGAAEVGMPLVEQRAAELESVLST